MSILNYLNTKQLERFRKRSFKKGEILFHERDYCGEISFVIKGEIRISSYSLSGSEIVYNVIKSGGIFGNNLAFSSRKEYRGNVIGSQDGEILIAKRDDLLEILQENKEFLNAYLQVEADTIKELNSKLKIHSFGSAEERLDYLFYINNGSIKFSSVSNLARELFLSREATSRLIHRLEKEQKIKIQKTSLILI